MPDAKSPSVTSENEVKTPSNYNIKDENTAVKGKMSLKETSDIKDFDMDTKKEESILSGAFERIRGQS